MASTGGLTRRRGAAAGGGAGPSTEDGGGSEQVSSPAPKPGPSDKTTETSYTSENGHKIAFDPRDLSESAERNKQPKLTLMEEVLLMGLKDKQVRCCDGPRQDKGMLLMKCTGLSVVLE